MRLIQFRAKPESGAGEWIYGIPYCSLPNGDLNRMLDEGWSGSVRRNIDPATLCQFTGLVDRNGRPIYEGDIITSELAPSKPLESPLPIFGVVTWWEARAEFVIDCSAQGICRYAMDPFARKGEIVGNKFDNPELLEGGES